MSWVLRSHFKVTKSQDSGANVNLVSMHSSFILSKCHYRRGLSTSIFYTLRLDLSREEDIPLWKHEDGVYANVFSTWRTWLQLRSVHPVCKWSKDIWFQQSTPKYSFLVWVALHQRLQTCDRMQMWSIAVNPVCILCNEEHETCCHLFFSCKYSTQVWKSLVGGILQ